MDKKNILHVIHSLDVGGAERLVVNFTEETNADKFHVMVCCLDRIGVLGEDLKSKGFYVRALGRKPGIDWGLILRLREIMKKKNIDIVHAHQYPAFFYTSLAKNFSRKPRIIFTEHGRFYPDKMRIKRFFFNPLLARFVSKIFAISEATKEAMVRYDNFSSKRVHVIYNGVTFQTNEINRVNKRNELNISNNTFLLVTAARLDSIKNHRMLIRMMKAVSKSASDCKLLILGNGPEYNNLSAGLKENGLTDSICLLGYREDVAEIFQAADLFLLSSVSEGTSVTLLEAMCAGLPAIVTNVGGNPEVLKDGETGFLVESDDDQAMAEKVFQLHQDRNLAKRLGEAGGKRARTLFSFENMMQQYEEIYIRDGE